MKILERIKNFFQVDEYVPQDRKTQIIYIAIFLVILVLPFFLDYHGNGGDGINLFGLKLPGLCLSKELFGVRCPGCGITRAFVLMTHGQFLEAIHLHRLAIPLYIFFILFLAYRIYCLCAPGRKNPALLVKLQFYIPFSMILLLLINWLADFFI